MFSSWALKCSVANRFAERIGALSRNPPFSEMFSSFQGIEVDVDKRQKQLGRIEDIAENLLGFLEADGEARGNVSKTLENVQDR